MSSYNESSRKGCVQDGQIVNSRRHAMVAHTTKLDKDCAFRGSSAMKIDLSKLGSIPGKKYGELLNDPV